MEIVEDVVIVGAGIAGLATAVALKRVGIKALVLEKSDGLRTTGTALSLAKNAWVALEALGVAHKLTSVYDSTKKGYFTNLATGTIQEITLPETSSNHGLRTVHRTALLNAFAEELPTESIRFSCKITVIETQAHDGGSSLAVVHLEDGTVIKAKVLIGCDGVHSMVAKWLGLAPPVHSGRSAVLGLAVFPQSHGLKQEFHQFLGESKRLGFVPLPDKEIYWFLTCTSPSKEVHLRDPKEIQREVLENYAKDLPGLYTDIVKHSEPSTLTWAPLMFRQPWKVASGNLSKQNITVAGDAFHPMTPDLGQGGCSALEDAVVLGRHIGTSFKKNGGLVPSEMPQALRNYVEERRWRAVWLITGSYLSGWVQQGGFDSWQVVKFFRDAIFYKFIFPKLANIVRYDCGKLP